MHWKVVENQVVKLLTVYWMWKKKGKAKMVDGFKEKLYLSFPDLHYQILTE
jgi:hypothetical protein